MDSASDPVRVYFKVHGRVQGVYFRASAAQQAQSLGLTGWVRNCNDGSVEGIAEGPRSRVENLIAWCGQGPPSAKVTHVDAQWESAQNMFQAFSIKR